MPPVSLVLLLDHAFLLRLPTARNFRKATFAVMNDVETLRSFEENAGLKEELGKKEKELQEVKEQLSAIKKAIDQ